MKNNEIMITVKFSDNAEENEYIRYMSFLVLKDITLGELADGIYYGLKKRKSDDDIKCFKLFESHIKNKNPKFILHYAFKDTDENSGGIIDFNAKKNFTLTQLGIVTSTCISVSDNETPDFLFEKNKGSYIIKGNDTEYNISTRNINDIEPSVIQIIPAGAKPKKNIKDILWAVGMSVITIGLGFAVRFLMSGKNSGFGTNMIMMSAGMSIISCITMLVNSFHQMNKSDSDAKEWKKNYEKYINKIIKKITDYQIQDIVYLNTLYPPADRLFHSVENADSNIFGRSHNDSDFMKISLGSSEQIEPLFEIKAEKKDNISEENIWYKLKYDNSNPNKYIPFEFKIISDEKDKEFNNNLPYLSDIAYNFANNTSNNQDSQGFRYLKNYSSDENTRKLEPRLVIELKNCGALGVISDDYKILQNFIRHIVFELSFYHSPENIQFVFFFKSNKNESERNQIAGNYKYLPHTNELFENMSQFIFDEKSAGEAFSQLFNIVSKRSENSKEEESENSKSDDSKKESSKPEPKYTQIVCILFDSYNIKETAFSRFLPEAPKQGENFQNNLGLSFIFLQDLKDKLPKYCGNIINLKPDSGTFQKRYNILSREMIPKKINDSGISESKAFKNDYIFTDKSEYEFEKAYRQLSSLYYKRISENGEVPSKVSLFEIWDIDVKDTEENKVIEQIKQRWNSSDITKGLNVPIGKNERGLTYLDMHQNGHGPHGLVAGTTGSGKSETIITYVIGCCMKYKPEDLNFMLIDMKGGGFSDRLGKLPHLVGSVTNTTGEAEGISSEYMLKRFLDVLNYEVRKRENILKKLDTDDIDSYIDARKEVIQYREEIKSGKKTFKDIQKIFNGKNKDNRCSACNPENDEPEPLAHLLLIVDEFTELKRFSTDSNGIDFIKDITTIARIGRTLGFHIILVSQNIEGAITDDIRVNSKARICLRVATKGASKDMLGTPVASDPEMPYNGRAYMLVNGQLEYFQSAYTKANRNTSLKDAVEIKLVPDCGAYESFYNSDNDNEEIKIQKDKTDKDDTQLNYIINTINALVERDKYKLPEPLFLQPLKADKKSVIDKTEWEN